MLLELVSDIALARRGHVKDFEGDGVLLYFAIYRYLRTAASVARLAVSIGLVVALPEIV